MNLAGNEQTDDAMVVACSECFKNLEVLDLDEHGTVPYKKETVEAIRKNLPNLRVFRDDVAQEF